MKKTLSLIPLLTVIALIFSACSVLDGDQTDYLPYTAYIDDNGADGTDSIADAARRYTWVTKEDIPDPKDKTISVSILGTQYDANYFDKKAQTFGRPEYVYKTEAGDEIAVDGSGKILSFETAGSVSYYSEDPSQESVKPRMKSPEEYLEIATQFARSIYGEDVISNYVGALPQIASTKIWVSFSGALNQQSAYWITDNFTINISAEGEFLAYYDSGVNDFKNKTIPDALTNDRIKQIILDSLIDKNAQIELSNTKFLVILGDGRFACYTNFRISGVTDENEWASVIIPLE